MGGTLAVTNVEAGRLPGLMRGRLLLARVISTFLLAFTPAPAAVQTAELQVQRPWAYKTQVGSSAEAVQYMATTAATTDDDFWLLLVCRDDGQVTISFLHVNGFPYQLQNPVSVSLKVDIDPIVTLSALLIQQQQISAEPALSHHLLPYLIEGTRLFVTVSDRGGGRHNYNFLLQPNDVALKSIRARCLEPQRQ